MMLNVGDGGSLLEIRGSYGKVRMEFKLLKCLGRKKLENLYRVWGWI